MIYRCQTFLTNFIGFPENPHDNEQIAGQTKDGGNDNPARREDVGIESLLGAARPCHQDVAYDDKDTGRHQDATTAHYETEGVFNAAEYSVHISG